MSLRTHSALFTATLSATLAAPMALAAAPAPADVIYTGGDIVTVDELRPLAQAVAVKGGKIVAVGYSKDVLKHKGAKTKVVDLGGNTLVPGFIDAHGHVFNAGVQALAANLLSAPDGLAATTPGQAELHPPGSCRRMGGSR